MKSPKKLPEMLGQRKHTGQQEKFCTNLAMTGSELTCRNFNLVVM